MSRLRISKSGAIVLAVAILILVAAPLMYVRAGMGALDSDNPDSKAALQAPSEDVQVVSAQQTVADTPAAADALATAGEQTSADAQATADARTTAPAAAQPGTASSTVGQVPEDIKTSWAREDIRSLVKAGVVTGYPDGTFKPDQPITRAELAAMVSRALELTDGKTSEFTDVNSHWAKPYIAALEAQGLIEPGSRKKFGPDETISRAEAISTMVKAARVNEDFQKALAGTQPSFTDVDSTSPYFTTVETAEQLGIVPLRYGLALEPSRAVTRAEAAVMIKSVMDIHSYEGIISSVDSETHDLSVVDSSSKQVSLAAPSDVVTVRNGLVTDVSKVREGDIVQIIASGTDARFISSLGEVTKEDLVTRASDAVNGLLTEDQIAAVMAGNWKSVEADLKPKLKDRLIEEGLTAAEADALVSRQWSTVKDLAKARLIDTVADRMGLPSEVVSSLANQDMDSARNYAEQKATEYVLAKLMASGGNSQQG